MRPYCKHQKDLGWDKLADEKITIYHYKLSPAANRSQKALKDEVWEQLLQEESVSITKEDIEFLKKPYFKDSYDETLNDPDYEPSKSNYFPTKEIKLACWVNYDESPKGLLCKPCPVCGYKYGTAWKKEEVPKGIITFLKELPDSTKSPAWI